MANEITTLYATGYTLYALIWDESKNVGYQVGEVFEDHGTNSRTNADYAVALTEEAVGYYAADYPSWVERGTYETAIYLQVGAAPANSDTGVAGPTELYWTGSAAVTVPETNAVNICNKALAKLGGGEDTRTITALGIVGDPTSELCELFYTPVRKEVLKRMEPQECTYYVDLGDESSFSGEKADWTYVFDLPSDNLKVLRQVDEGNHRVEYRYDIKQNQLFTNILSNTDRDSAYIEYVKNETDGDVFSNEVVETMATLLSSLLAPRIVGGERGDVIADKQYEKYEKVILPTSIGINRSQLHDDERHDERKYNWLGSRPFYD